jgi:hypothetical protein
MTFFRIDRALTGTAGVSPASSYAFTPVRVENSTLTRVAFDEAGQGARGPSKERLRQTDAARVLFQLDNLCSLDPLLSTRNRYG